jgi:hypothetical protein
LIGAPNGPAEGEIPGQRLANETPALNVNKRRQVTSESSDFA